MMTLLFQAPAMMNKQNMMYRGGYDRGYEMHGTNGFIQLHGALFLLIQLALLFLLIAAGRYVWKKGTKVH
jgi:hypothetical protein